MNVPHGEFLTEDCAEPEPHAEVRAECEFGTACYLFDNQTEDCSKNNADERGGDHALPADQSTGTCHQDGIAELNAANLFTGFLLDVSTALGTEYGYEENETRPGLRAKGLENMVHTTL